MLQVTPRVAEFQSEHITIDEIASFYNINGIEPPLDRPYTWSNSVTTLDGFMHFLEDNASDVR
jgi:hypothetical protein